MFYLYRKENYYSVKADGTSNYLLIKALNPLLIGILNFPNYNPISQPNYHFKMIMLLEAVTLRWHQECRLIPEPAIQFD